MVDWQSPDVIAVSLSLCAYFVFIGATIIIWEILLALPFDVAVVSRRQLSVSGVMYWLARPSMLVVLIPGICVRTSRMRLDCTPWGYAIYVSGYINQTCTSGLLLLRVVALSRDNKWIRSTLIAYYLCNIVLFVYELSQMRFIWSETIGACTLESQKMNLICTVVIALFEFLCLGCLIYLLRRGIRGKGMWEFLHRQGLLWFASVTFAHTCSMTMLALNLNDPLSEMGQGSSIVTSTVCATRMYSDLMEFAIADEARHSTAQDTSWGSSTLSSAILRFKRILGPTSSGATDSYALSALTDTRPQFSSA
ncbi:hypothetical protein AURDEDRAFT_187418 [Auricularia subglabra TFB-10046 SS5]|nr:hypothetical protein AURDEDRAFT_187418 [Auricularia subglabra TFB-10046 SS5]